MLKKNKIPFDFILEYLMPAHPRVRPMFGVHSVYVGEKIVLAFRKREDHIDDNGVWVAIVKGHHQSIKKEFPSLRPILMFGAGETGWQNLPEAADDFESSVISICELIVKGDERIGTIPKPKRKKKK